MFHSFRFMFLISLLYFFGFWLVLFRYLFFSLIIPDIIMLYSEDTRMRLDNRDAGRSISDFV